MFICRQQLLRATKQRYASLIAPTRRYVHTVRPPLPAFSNERPLRPTPDVSTKSVQTDTNPPSHTRPTATEASQPGGTTSDFSDTPSGQTENIEDEASTVPEHVVARVSEVLSNTSASIEDLLWSVPVFAELRDVDAMDKVVERLLDRPNGEPPSPALLEQILAALTETGFAHRVAINRVLKAIQSTHSIDEVPIVYLAKMTDDFVFRTFKASLDRPALTMVAPVLIDYLLRVHRDPRLVQPPYTQPYILWIVFKMMLRLVQCKQNQLVLAILRQLVQAKVIPSNMVAGIDMTGGNFGNIILTVILRCCATWGWPNRAVHLLNSYLDWDKDVPSTFSPTLVKVIDTLLQDRLTLTSLRNASALIIRFLSLPHLDLPTGLLQRFYEKVLEDGRATLAVAVYKTTRTKSVLQKYNYPVPTGKVLLWLFRQAHAMHDVQMMRSLATQVVKENVELPEPVRAPFLLITASNGMFNLARVLWERAQAKQDRTILCDAAVMVRLVSIAHARIRFRQKCIQEQGIQFRASDGQPDARASIMSSPPADVSEDLSILSDDADETSASDSIEGDDEDPEMSFEEQIDNYRAFAGSVIEAFVEYNFPLRNASRVHLNALARAYIIHGDEDAAMKALQVVLHRNETPDLHDANVALSAVAARNAQAGAQVIEQMVKLGLKPDTVTFGTVINHAALQGDFALVNKLIVRSRSTLR